MLIFVYDWVENIVGKRENVTIIVFFFSELEKNKFKKKKNKHTHIFHLKKALNVVVD